MARSKTTTLPDELLSSLEARLAGTLKPIQPSSDIVQRLRERIHFPAREQIALRLSDWKKMFLVLGGVMSGMVVVITLARAFFYLWSRKSM
ncbi:MAG: hypothetical protein ACOYYF_01305 [Chloroflexota bacterium]|nr:hypothetical protein [Chloroflexota bacterium]MBI5703864.1 hypothetical protein [Chloroflexota bacterium]